MSEAGSSAGRKAGSCQLRALAPWGAEPVGGLSPRLETSAPAHASASALRSPPLRKGLGGDGGRLQLLAEERAPPWGGRKADATAIPPQAKYKAREAALKAQSERKPGGDREERGKLPESPKRAEEIWQQSVIGDYLARFKVAGSWKGVAQQAAYTGRLRPQGTLAIADTPVCLQNDRVKALKAMEMTWNNMEKKEKLMWIKKAAEDQKRYEVGRILLLGPVGGVELGPPPSTALVGASFCVGSFPPWVGRGPKRPSLGCVTRANLPTSFSEPRSHISKVGSVMPVTWVQL